jgi:hypothetical protein
MLISNRWTQLAQFRVLVQYMGDTFGIEDRSVAWPPRAQGPGALRASPAATLDPRVGFQLQKRLGIGENIGERAIWIYFLS